MPPLVGGFLLGAIALSFHLLTPNRKTQTSNPVGTLAAEIEFICGLFAAFCGHAKED
ncbi:hypothetical protein NDA01_21535 [Trichocoleus desertorum AS-A10]|uniref:hypothetical protein n=1 Tax=Trichocoleus desertorum TaxID=1481672 RepID=UPI003296D616